MIWRVACQLIGSLALLLLAAGSFQAAIQRKTSACWLGTGDWQLREEGKEARLVEFKWNRVDLPARSKRDCWYVNAPSIRSESDQLLAYGLKGRQPSVYLSSDEGEHTRWLIEIVERTRPRDPKSKSAVKGIKEGPEGFTFRALVARGEFKNWYLAAEDPPKEQKERNDKGAVTRRLTLVRGKKQATIFEYVQTIYHAKYTHR